MADILVLLVIVVLVGIAIAYIRKQKKSGATCIGCSHAGQCAKRRQGGCGTNMK